jgi:NADP-dependent 3-hydroxy acid dehydrogenase YdfG
LETGAAAGIGKATALEFAKSGYSTFLVDHNQEKLKKAVCEDFHSFQIDYYCVGPALICSW